MKLKDKFVIVDDQNISRLSKLYGEIEDADELSKIVNNHLSVAIDEIEEDETTCALKGLDVMNFSSVLAHGTAISTQEALADVTPINWSDDVMDGQYKNETIIKAKTEEKDMTKELSIESIKKEIIDKMMNNMDILNCLNCEKFVNEGYKISDLYNNVIFDYDASNDVMSDYIAVEVVEHEYLSGSKYIVMIKFGLNTNDSDKRNLDKISLTLKNIINDLYPDRKKFSNNIFYTKQPEYTHMYYASGREYIYEHYALNRVITFEIE